MPTTSCGPNDASVYFVYFSHMKGTKTGGRRAGVPNRRTRAIKERLLRDEALTVESTVEAIRRGQQYDIRRLLNTNGNFKSIHELTEEEAWCIAGAEVIVKNAEAGDGHTDRVLKLKFIDRRGYVELAAKHQGMLTEKVELSGDEALIAALMAGRKRAAESKKC